jgi:hypothetical protein
MGLERPPTGVLPREPPPPNRTLTPRRQNRAAFSFVVNLIIPGTPILSLVSVFINEHHPSILGERPQPGASDCDWQPFDFALHRCGQGLVVVRVQQCAVQCGPAAVVGAGCLL